MTPDDDGEVDTLANLTDVTIADKGDVVTSLQVFLLLASDAIDPNYTTEKTYQLGDIVVNKNTWSSMGAL